MKEFLRKCKKKMRERFFHYDSWVYPLYFWKRFPIHHIPSLMLQRLIIYSFLGRTNRILPVHFPPLKGVLMRSNTALLGGLRYFGWWEKELRDIFRIYAPKVKTFIEVGAMEGFYEIIVRKLNPRCTIIAVEPKQGAQEQVEENFRINNLNPHDRVVFRKEFVGDNPEVGRVTMAQLITGHDHPLFILMDIDGGEGDALMGGLDALASTPIYFLIETHSPDLEKACCKILENLGYTVSIIHNAWWRHFLPEERPAPQHGIHHNRWLFATNIK